MILNGKGSTGCKKTLELPLSVGSLPPLLKPRPGVSHFSFPCPTPLQATSQAHRPFHRRVFTKGFRMTKILNKDRVKQRQDQ